MLITDELLKEISTLSKEKRNDLLEPKLLEAYDAFKRSEKVDELAYVVLELANLNAVSGLRALNKAKEYYSELEQIEPGAQSKWISAGFYHGIRDYRRVIEIVDGIDPSDPDRLCRYSALVVKGRACIAINLVSDVRKVLDELIRLVSEQPEGLSYGDEIELIESSIGNAELKPKCCELLALIAPRINDPEFLKRAQRLLGSNDCS